MKIVEINDNDIYGKIFNGYDIMEEFNSKRNSQVSQLVINKYSDNPNVHSIFNSRRGLELEKQIHQLESEILSTHSLISITSEYLNNNSIYGMADLAHIHQFHNSNYNLTRLLEMAQIKPTIISFHDPWFMTGRCVHPGECNKWKNGCEKCKNLNTLFSFKEDNCAELWKIKSEVLSNADMDIIVSSEFMMGMIKEHPYTRNLKVHVLPFGLDVKKFEFKISKGQAKEKLGIDPESIVIFFRSAEEKGIKYIVEALKKLKTKEKVTLLTCSEVGLVKELEDKYNLVELGYINENEIKKCYNAADIFLMPSLGESFGMMAIEAMASKLPVVVFDNTALPTVTNAPEVGILVKNKDSKDLHDKIKELIENEEYRVQRGELGRALVEEKYKIEDYYNKLHKIYTSAYERQAYKLQNQVANQTINYKNQYVQLLLPKLKKIYERVFPNDSTPDFFKGVKIKESKNNKINYSDKDVQQLIIKFNKLLYFNTLSVDNKESGIRKTLLYKTLKKSKILKYIVRKIRAIKNRLTNKSKKEITTLNNQIQRIYQQNLEDRNIMLSKISELEQLQYQNEKNLNFQKSKNKLLIEEINSLRSECARVENGLYNMCEALKYRLWITNNSLNKIIYEESLKNKRKKKNFNPKVSIIIPVYNGDNYIREALDCALNQTYKNIEIIVVDDGSKDDKSEKIVKSYKQNIAYYKKENGGVSSALNYGIKKMTGEYFAWLSHDDLIDTNHIEKLVEFCSYEEHENQIPYSSFKIINEKGRIRIEDTIEVQLSCSDYKVSMTKNLYTLLQGEINGGSVLIPKDAFKKYGYFAEEQRITQERDMWSRLLKVYQFINIPYATASIRVHDKRVSTKVNEVVEKTNEKNLDILKQISQQEILEFEPSYNEFLEKTKKYYQIHNNQIMVENIEKLQEEAEK